MTKGIECMKCLRINSGKGEYSLDGVTYEEINKIDKESILVIVDMILQPELQVEFDKDTGGQITNQAHKIIYTKLYEKFIDLERNKQQFVEETTELYRSAYEKYKIPEVESA